MVDKQRGERLRKARLSARGGKDTKGLPREEFFRQDQQDFLDWEGRAGPLSCPCLWLGKLGRPVVKMALGSRLATMDALWYYTLVWLGRCL